MAAALGRLDEGERVLMRVLLALLALTSAIAAGPETDLPSRTDQIRAYVSLLDAHIAVTQMGWLDRSVAEAQYLRLSVRLVELVSLAPVDDLERMTYRGEIRQLESDVATLRNERSRFVAELARLRKLVSPSPK